MSTVNQDGKDNSTSQYEIELFWDGEISALDPLFHEKLSSRWKGELAESETTLQEARSEGTFVSRSYAGSCLPSPQRRAAVLEELHIKHVYRDGITRAQVKAAFPIRSANGEQPWYKSPAEAQFAARYAADCRLYPLLTLADLASTFGFVKEDDDLSLEDSVKQAISRFDGRQRGFSVTQEHAWESFCDWLAPLCVDEVSVAELRHWGRCHRQWLRTSNLVQRYLWMFQKGGGDLVPASAFAIEAIQRATFLECGAGRCTISVLEDFWIGPPCPERESLRFQYVPYGDVGIDG